MAEILGNLSILEAIYWASAIIGGTLFVLRLVMALFGFGAEDADVDLDVDGGHVDVFSGDSDFSFKALSFQGLASFFMMFGLSGLTLLSAEVHWAWVVLGSLAVGAFAVWVVSQIYRQMFRLQSDGTVNIRNAIGQTGQVYLRITEKGLGQVQVEVQGGLRIFDAVSADHTPISTGEHVLVVDMIGPRTLVVKKM